MVKLTVLYGYPTDPEAFEDYYANTHMPLVGKVSNIQRAEIGRTIATPEDEKPPYYRIAELWFESLDQMQESLGSPEGREVVDDIQNFATGGATTLVSEVD